MKHNVDEAHKGEDTEAKNQAFHPTRYGKYGIGWHQNALQQLFDIQDYNLSNNSQANGEWA